MLISEARAETDSITVQDTDEIPAAPESMESGWLNMVPMVLIFVVFYFFLIRPQEKRRKQQEKLTSSVKRGEDIVTSSGICGVVRKVNDSDNTLMLEVANGVEIKILKSAIADVISRRTEDGAASKDAKKDGKKDEKHKAKSKKKK